MADADVGWAGLEDDAAAAREQLVGTLSTDCVGCRYYGGIAHAGEFVALVREASAWCL
jgi:hypothetical protein